MKDKAERTIEQGKRELKDKKDQNKTYFQAFKNYIKESLIGVKDFITGKYR